MNKINIQDNTLIWTFNLDSVFITVEDGTRILSMYWADDFGISIDDTEDDAFLINERIQTDFLIPANSVFYDSCKEAIPNNYIIFSDAKPAESIKRVEFHFVNEGMRIYIDSDYKSEFETISSSLTFYGSNGGSVQAPGYKDNFVNFLRSLISSVKNNQDSLDGNNNVLKKRIE